MDRGVAEGEAVGAQQRVSELIDRLRRYWRLTQEQMAAGLGMTQPKVSARLNCKRHWNEEELAAVATYFKVSVGDLFGPPEQAIACSAAAGGPDNHRYAEQMPLPIVVDAAA